MFELKLSFVPSSFQNGNGIDLLYSLARIVCNKYYSGYPGVRDDLIQEAVIKADSLLKQGDYTPERGSLYNYLFTGMRNAMTNYARREGSNSSLDSIAEQETYQDHPEVESWEDFFEDESFRKIKSRILNLMEGRIVINLWTNVSEEEKKILSRLLGKHTKMQEVPETFDISGDLILWAMLLFAGDRISFPPDSVLERLLRQARVYHLLKTGKTPKEVADIVGLRSQHITRIQKSVETALEEYESAEH